MSTRVSIINRIVITVCIQIQPIRRFRINIFSSVRRDKSTPLGAIISCVEVVKFCVLVVIVTAISDGVGICDLIIIGVNYFTVTPFIVSILLLYYQLRTLSSTVPKSVRLPQKRRRILVFVLRKISCKQLFECCNVDVFDCFFCIFQQIAEGIGLRNALQGARVAIL